MRAAMLLLALCPRGTCMMAMHASPRLSPMRVCQPAAGRCVTARRARPSLSSEPPRTEAELAIERRDWRRAMRADVLRFAGPALAGVLADPLMSVIDALCCGRFCSTLQLASLGPSLAVFGFMNYFFFFLTAATTVRVTRALATGDEAGATAFLSSAFTLAVGCGFGLGATIRFLAPRLVGLTGCVPELVPVAARYLRIRSLGQPVVLASMVTQVRRDRAEIAA